MLGYFSSAGNIVNKTW